MLRMTAMYVPKREIPISPCIPGSKSFPGVLAPCGGGNTQKNGRKRRMADFYRRTLPSRGSFFLDNGCAGRYNSPCS